MDIPVKTLKSGFSLPVYGLGTWQMGGHFETDHSNDEREIVAIQTAIDQGITHIDTAESYGDGNCEELVGQAIRGFDRQNLFLATKVSYGMEDGYDGVLRSAEASMRRLGVDYLDMYLLHSHPGDNGMLPEIMKAMDRLVGQGAVKNIGVCNMGVESFKKTQSHTANKVVCNQVHYSLRMREAEQKGVIAYCQENDVFITAWGPLEKGMLEAGNLLKDLAAKYGKTPYQVALNWLLAQPNVVTIPKTTNPEHLQENLGALGWSLSAEDIANLTRNFPDQAFVSERVPLDQPALRNK